MSINRFQEMLLEAYPVIKYIPVDACDSEAVDEAVAKGETGDRLFDFLWRELASVNSCAEFGDAMALLDNAIRDIEAVRERIGRAM